MGSQWTSKYAILRDLSFAQGRKVPAAIVGSIGIGQKPPAITIKEDTEKEFFQNCVGEGDVYTKPDLSLIKKMINMVQECDPADDEVPGKVVEISKLNPLTEEFVPKKMDIDAENNEATNKVSIHQDHGNGDSTAKVNQVNTKREAKPLKKRRERNAALISLLEKEQTSVTFLRDENISSPTNQTSKKKTEAGNNNMQSSEVKLLKPNYFMIDTNVTEAVEKVNDWLQKPSELQLQKTKAINLSPKNMFKKRAPASLIVEGTCMFKRKSDTSSIKSSDSETAVKHSDSVFVPSSNANEYYKKFVERRQVHEMAQEDIWKKAERLMKEIDAKRLKENEQRIAESLDSAVEVAGITQDDDSAKNGSRPTLPLNIPGLNSSVSLSIILPQHRHDLPEECKVCLALAKYKHLNAPTQ